MKGKTEDRQVIFISSTKDTPNLLHDNIVRFKNGSSIETLNTPTENCRGNRSKIIWYLEEKPQSLFRRFINMIKRWFKK
jgi:hypothetical protein